MAETSSIEWTDATWNPITGCSVVSPGCANCYAMRLAGGRLRNHESRRGLTQNTKAGPIWTGEVRLNEAWLDQPLRWRRPRRIFVCAHGDLFHEAVPDAWIDQVVARMALSPWHTYQVLTKRSERMRGYFASPDLPHRLAVAAIEAGPELGVDGAKPAHATMIKLSAGGGLVWPLPLPNIWLGVSVEDQPRADARVTDLLMTPAAVRYVSAEPLLGQIDFNVLDIGETRVDALTGLVQTRRRYPDGGLGDYTRHGELPKLDWIIVGGESGPRPMHPEWARKIRDDCAAAGTAFFFKQWGSWGPVMDGSHLISEGLGREGARFEGAVASIVRRGDGHADIWRVGKTLAGRRLDGRTHDDMPGRLP